MDVSMFSLVILLGLAVLMQPAHAQTSKYILLIMFICRSIIHIYVTVNCGNQSLPGMPEMFSQY